MKSTAVIILCYNNQGYLKQFLPSLIAHTPLEVQLWVVDNGSSDNAEQLLQDHFPKVNYISFDQNFGFAEGYNQAIAKIEAENLILLNSDVEVSENWLAPLVHKLEAPMVGAVMPKIKSFANKDQFEYAGAAGGFIDFLGYPFCRGRIFEKLEKDIGQYDDSREIFWATGACFAINRSLFLENGGFDGSYFAHMEEIDLCWRLLNRGYRNFYVGDSVVYHVGGGTLQKSNPRKTYLNFRNSLTTLVKNLPSVQIIPVVLMRLVLDGVVAIRYLLSGNFGDFGAILKSHFSFYATLPTTLGKRGRILNRVKRKPFSIVWAHFVLKKQYYHEL